MDTSPSPSQKDQPPQENRAQSNQPSTALVPLNSTMHSIPRETHPPGYYDGEYQPGAYQQGAYQPGAYQPYYGQYGSASSPPGYPPPYVIYYPGQPLNAADLPTVRENTPQRPRREARGEQGEEAGRQEFTAGFQDKAVRAKFVRKVYVIIMLQLLFTVGNIALFIYEPNVKRFVQKHHYLFYVAMAIFFTVYIGLACFQSARRKFPLNFIALAIFTIAASYMFSTLSTHFDTNAVLMAAAICAAVCFVVTILSFYTKFDFTSCGPILCILLILLFLFGLIAIFFPTMVMRMLYAALGATVFTMMLAFDTQLMMGGKNYELSPEEYIFAALQIYIDIVYIFLFLLMLIGGSEAN